MGCAGFFDEYVKWLDADVAHRVRCVLTTVMFGSSAFSYGVRSDVAMIGQGQGYHPSRRTEGKFARVSPATFERDMVELENPRGVTFGLRITLEDVPTVVVTNKADPTIAPVKFHPWDCERGEIGLLTGSGGRSVFGLLFQKETVPK